VSTHGVVTSTATIALTAVQRNVRAPLPGQLWSNVRGIADSEPERTNRKDIALSGAALMRHLHGGPMNRPFAGSGPDV
jgi:hypothetical protein